MFNETLVLSIAIGAVITYIVFMNTWSMCNFFHQSDIRFQIITKIDPISFVNSILEGLLCLKVYINSNWYIVLFIRTNPIDIKEDLPILAY